MGVDNQPLFHLAPGRDWPVQCEHGKLPGVFRGRSSQQHAIGDFASQNGRLQIGDHNNLLTHEFLRRVVPGDPRNDVEPMPDAAGRGRWLVSELDAARGMAPVAPEQPARRRRRDSGADMHPDDVPDPHVLGMSWHDTAARQIEDATKPLVEVVRELAAL